MPEMQPRELLTEVIAYSLVISACERGQRPRGAIRLLRGTEPQGLLPNVVAYSVAISVCEKGT